MSAVRRGNLGESQAEEGYLSGLFAKRFKHSLRACASLFFQQSQCFKVAGVVYYTDGLRISKSLAQIEAETGMRYVNTSVSSKACFTECSRCRAWWRI